MAGTEILTTYISNPFPRLKAFLKPPVDGEKTGKGKITSVPSVAGFSHSSRQSTLHKDKTPAALALRSLKVCDSFTNSQSHDKLASRVGCPKFLAPLHKLKPLNPF